MHGDTGGLQQQSGSAAVGYLTRWTLLTGQCSTPRRGRAKNCQYFRMNTSACSQCLPRLHVRCTRYDHCRRSTTAIKVHLCVIHEDLPAAVKTKTHTHRVRTISATVANRLQSTDHATQAVATVSARDQGKPAEKRRRQPGVADRRRVGVCTSVALCPGSRPTSLRVTAPFRCSLPARRVATAATLGQAPSRNHSLVASSTLTASSFFAIFSHSGHPRS